MVLSEYSDQADIADQLTQLLIIVFFIFFCWQDSRSHISVTDGTEHILQAACILLSSGFMPLIS
jgi:hypothetical protein